MNMYLNLEYTKQHPRSDLVGMNLGSGLQLLIRGKTKAGFPSEGSL